jgi:hypothetical protein
MAPYEMDIRDCIQGFKARGASTDGSQPTVAEVKLRGATTPPRLMNSWYVAKLIKPSAI